MEKELQTIEINSPTALIQQAIDKGVPVETMERLLAMRRELKAEHAKEEFDKAMANFQSECPEIKRTKEVRTKSGALAYKYAPIESIVKQVKPFLKDNGFSYAIKTETSEKVKSTCIIKHVAGHSEESSMEVPLGNKTAIMSDSQVVAAASTFSKRYAFCNALGILTGDEDNDGADKPVETITEDQIKKLDAGLNEIKADRSKFFAYLKVKNLSELPVDRFSMARIAIESSKKRQAASLAKEGK